MKKNIYLFVFFLLSSQIFAQCMRNTFNIVKIDCFSPDSGIIVPVYSLPTIENQVNIFTIDTLYVNVGDTVNFQLNSGHNAVEVDSSIWVANDTISNGGFYLPYSVDSFIVIDSIGTYYYVCQSHVNLGMKAIIIATTTQFSYEWFNASNVLPISINDSLISDSCGAFLLKIYDKNGSLCDTAHRFLGCPLKLGGGQTNIKCFGDSTGELTRIASSGSPPYFYEWYRDGIFFASGSNDTIESNLSAGQYQVIVLDSKICSDTMITDFHNPQQLLFHSISFDNINCHNASTILKLLVKGGSKTNGTGYAYFLIQHNDTIAASDSSSNFTILGLSPQSSIPDTVIFNNVYASVDSLLILIVDSVGCTKDTTIFIDEPDSLSITFINYNDTLLCFGELTGITAIISGAAPDSNGNYIIEWENGTIFPQTILEAGHHEMIVTDNDGCSDTGFVSIEGPDSLVVSINPTNPSCFGNDGFIDVVVSGGTLPYEYLWSTGEIGTSISALVVGTYWIIVTDSCGIKDSLGIVLSPYISTLNINNFFLTDPSCADNDGAIDVNVSGGYFPYTYQWSNGEITQDIDLLGFGNYTIVITDYCGDTTAQTYMLNQMQNTVSAIGFHSYFSLWSSIEVTTSNPPYTVQWMMPDSTIITADSIRGLCEGNYFVTVTDSMNCQDTLHLNVFYNINQLIDANTSTVIDTSWGLGPFSYLWSDGQTTSHADSLCEGIHTVTVTANGGPFACDLSESFSISEMEVILSPTETIIYCENNFDGTIIANPSGGTPQYSFLWSTGVTLDRITENLNPGLYYVSIFDKNGCRLDTSIIITDLTAECIPNVFTPNGDNVNDFWELEDSFLYLESTITIYGRFGKKIFESIGYKDPWNGTNKKGRSLPDGTYFYSIILKEGVETIRGTITILQ